ncbi:helical backbone metal receptor [Congregibacter sp.]|uniref:helical backbone metal receptor n=1 Tax=Congregibacter sp. TaxID=2744308 RepID=UPI003F6ABDD3
MKNHSSFIQTPMLPVSKLRYLLLPAVWLLLALPHAHAAVHASDAEGRRVELSAPATRIVALAPHIVENLSAIGAQDTIVGTVQYSDYPASAKRIPRLGGVGSVSLEHIVALQPDLIILWGSGTPTGLRSSIERLKLPYFVDEIRSLNELGNSFEALGALTGHSAEGTLAARQLTQSLTQREAIQAAQTTDDRPGVFLQLWDQPLQSIGGEHLLNEVIERCGGQSITRSISGLAPQVSMEAVLADDPALIIVESPAQAKHWHNYPRLQATRNDNIVIINPDLLHRPTLRLLDGMRQICERIAPIRNKADLN